MKKLLYFLALVLPFTASSQYYIYTVAGNGALDSAMNGVPATANGIAPVGVAADAAGNIYISDHFRHFIRKVSPSGIISTFAGTGTSGFSGDGGPGTAAQFARPGKMVFDAAGNLYVADANNNRVRKISPAGIVTTVAGDGTNTSAPDGTPATASGFYNPAAIAISPSGELYISERWNYQIRKVSATGIVTTVAGTGNYGYTGNGGPATAAEIDGARAIAFDPAGNLYLTFDYGVRKVDAAGNIHHFAGSSATGYSGDGGPATAAMFTGIRSIAADAAGNIYIADEFNSRIRKVSAGMVSTFAGTGMGGCTGDGGLASAADISVYNIQFDPTGNLYFTDDYNYLVRKISTTPPVSVSNYNAPSVSLFPNPAQSSVTINGPQQAYHVSFTNATGQTVLSQNVTGTSTVNIEALPTGLYLVKVCANGANYWSRLVKE